MVLDGASKCSMYAFKVNNGKLEKRKGSLYDFVNNCDELVLSGANIDTIPFDTFSNIKSLTSLDI
eukprot:Pgem_evm1s18295